ALDRTPAGRACTPGAQAAAPSLLPCLLDQDRIIAHQAFSEHQSMTPRLLAEWSNPLHNGIAPLGRSRRPSRVFIPRLSARESGSCSKGPRFLSMSIPSAIFSNQPEPCSSLARPRSLPTSRGLLGSRATRESPFWPPPAPTRPTTRN